MQEKKNKDENVLCKHIKAQYRGEGSRSGHTVTAGSTRSRGRLRFTALQGPDPRYNGKCLYIHVYADICVSVPLSISWHLMST